MNIGPIFMSPPGSYIIGDFDSAVEEQRLLPLPLWNTSFQTRIGYHQEDKALKCFQRLSDLGITISVALSNIANIRSTRTPEGGPFMPKHAVCGDRGCEIDTKFTSPLHVYEPDHPDADAEGYVAYPNIDLMEEMGTVVDRTREYEKI